MFSFVLILLPILLVNTWHGYLLLNIKDNKPETISEHAADNDKWLKIHRIVHVISSLLLISYALYYLHPLGLHTTANILIVGALLDVIEVMTLSKDMHHGPEALKSPHTFTAWGMGLSYMMFAVFLVRESSLPAWSMHAVWMLFMMMLGTSIILKFKKFWAFQMSYFLLLSTIIITAHQNLL
ncbi:hypothetical protein KC992_00885 [Candidatus Saccharibacteria bacterium]|nr:hypothetical protein [Candidatus Saccharibacteria bacterium]